MKLSPLKRAKGTIILTISCLVDGCKADLSQSPKYHRRHKVCERHSKTPAVVIGGIEKRFCQKCSRFHILVEFDNEKRSCRKRLDGHNRRRRKFQLDSLATTAGTPVSGHQQGTKILSQENLQKHQSVSVGYEWTMTTKPTNPNPITPYNNHLINHMDMANHIHACGIDQYYTLMQDLDNNVVFCEANWLQVCWLFDDYQDVQSLSRFM